MRARAAAGAPTAPRDADRTTCRPSRRARRSPCGDVNAAMGDGVDGVDEQLGAVLVGQRRDRCEIGHRADRVAGGRHSDPARARAQHLLKRPDRELERLRIGLREAHGRTAGACRREPGSDVCVVVQSGADDLVAGPQHTRDRACERECQGRHAGTEDDARGIRGEQLSDAASGTRQENVTGACGSELPTLVGDPPGSQPDFDSLDHAVDGLRARRAVQPSAAVRETRKAVAVHEGDLGPVRRCGQGWWRCLERSIDLGVPRACQSS